MKELLAQLTNLETESKNLINKQDTTAEEITAKLSEIKAHKAKIEVQKEIDSLEEERQKQAQIPVNEPIYAKPKDPDEKKWKGGMGEFLQAVAAASSPGGRMDNRLIYQNSATGLNESVTSEGGFMLDNDFIQGLFDAMMAESQVANRIRM
ncbi:MAG TPA: phage major capsid protein, partial [Clostridium sp.]|nr:phage major capsid protein [Clostridium sp.]